MQKRDFLKGVATFVALCTTGVDWALDTANELRQPQIVSFKHRREGDIYVFNDGNRTWERPISIKHSPRGRTTTVSCDNYAAVIHF